MDGAFPNPSPNYQGYWDQQPPAMQQEQPTYQDMMPINAYNQPNAGGYQMTPQYHQPGGYPTGQPYQQPVYWQYQQPNYGYHPQGQMYGPQHSYGPQQQAYNQQAHPYEPPIHQYNQPMGQQMAPIAPPAQLAPLVPTAYQNVDHQPYTRQANQPTVKEETDVKEEVREDLEMQNLEEYIKQEDSDSEDNDVKHVKKEKKKSKNDDRVKRPMNAFLVWSKEERKKMHGENPHMHNSDISKLLGLKWKALSTSQTKKWKEEARKIKIKHLMENPCYKYAPTRKNAKVTEEAEKCEKRGLGGPRVNQSRGVVCSTRELNISGVAPSPSHTHNLRSSSSKVNNAPNNGTNPKGPNQL